VFFIKTNSCYVSIEYNALYDIVFVCILYFALYLPRLAGGHREQVGFYRQDTEPRTQWITGALKWKGIGQTFHDRRRAWLALLVIRFDSQNRTTVQRAA